MNKSLFILFSGTQGFQRTIELLLVILIIGILAAIMIHAYLPLVIRASVLNGVTFGMEKFKREISYHWALYGEWPRNADGMKSFSSDSDLYNWYASIHFEKVELENGAIHLFFKDKLAGRILTCRPAVLKENISGPVIWICGAVPSNFFTWSLAGPDRTNIDNDYIPKSLRDY